MSDHGKVPVDLSDFSTRRLVVTSQKALVIVDVQRDFLDPTTRSMGGVGSWKKAFVTV